MKSLPNRSDETMWLRRWLRSNAVCVLAMLAFLLILKFQTPPSVEEQAIAAGGASAVSQPLPMADEHHVDPSKIPATGEILREPKQSTGPVSVAPSGWRRTDRGWENVASWQKPSEPLGEIVLRQEKREPKWVRDSLATLRGLPPLAFAMLQITAISAIVAVSRERRVDSTPTPSE